MTTRIKVLAAVLCVLVLATLGSAMVLRLPNPFMSARGKQPPADTSTPFNPAQWAWRSEEHWAVDQMVRDASEMLLFAAGEDPAKYQIHVSATAPVEHRYTMTLRGPKVSSPLSGTMVLQNHLWDPANLRDWTRQITARLPISPTSSAVERDLALQDLLSPTPAGIEGCQAKVSGQLTKFPASSWAHEQAAAVLSSLALYNTAGDFEDDRFILCRLSAHLAVAECLRSETSQESPSGKVSRVALLVVSGQARKAVQLLQQVRSQGSSELSSAAVTAWFNVLNMVAMRDCRPVKDPAKVTVAEALAAYSARCYRQSPKEAWDWLEARRQRLRPHGAYLARVALAGKFSVEMGHELTPDLLDSELQDLQLVYALKHDGRKLQEQDLCASLNTSPGRAYVPSSRSLQVIDWGIWARHFQGALLCDMTRTILFYQDLWGVKDACQQYLDVIEKRFQDLDLFPILQRRYSDVRPSVFQGAMLRAAAFARQHPELVPDSGFVCLNAKTRHGARPLGLPRYQDWLAIPVPFGTAYNLSRRSWEMTEMTPLRTSGLERFLELDPYDEWLAKQALKIRFPVGKPTPEAIEQMFSESKEMAKRWYLDWMIHAMDESDPKALEYQRELAAEDPSEFFALGFKLKNLKREPEAAEAYLNGFRKCQDRVMASNAMEWLVPYLYKVGRTQEAESVAQECAKVYSARGLGVMALLREQQGRLEEAEDWFGKLAERYDQQEDRIAFYQRHQSDHPAFKKKLESLLRGIFPQGLVRYDSATFPPHPIKGVGFASFSPLMEKWGVTRQAVIVALDGYRVDNQKQYFTVRAFTKEERMTLVVYQKGAYQTLEVVLPDRRFGVDMVDYQG